jgi:hypothetical protein
LVFYLREQHNNDEVVALSTKSTADSSTIATDPADNTLTSDPTSSPSPPMTPNDRLRWRTLHKFHTTSHQHHHERSRNETSEQRAERLEREAKVAATERAAARASAATNPTNHTATSPRNSNLGSGTGESGAFRRVNATIGMSGGGASHAIATRRVVHGQLIHLFTEASCWPSLTPEPSASVDEENVMTDEEAEGPKTFVWGDPLDAAMASVSPIIHRTPPSGNDQSWYTHDNMMDWMTRNKSMTTERDYGSSLLDFLMSCRWMAWQLDARRRYEHVSLTIAVTNLR